MSPVLGKKMRTCMKESHVLYIRLLFEKLEVPTKNRSAIFLKTSVLVLFFPLYVFLSPALLRKSLQQKPLTLFKLQKSPFGIYENPEILKLCQIVL